MARIRSIKPEFWSDERMARVSRDARLLFLGLINFADEEGRLRGSPLLIRANVFPYDAEVDVEAALQELAALGRIVRYTHDGEAYVWVCNFTEHQKTDPRLLSRLPAPPIRTQSTPTGRDGLVPSAPVGGRQATGVEVLVDTDKRVPSRGQVAGDRWQGTGECAPPPTAAIQPQTNPRAPARTQEGGEQEPLRDRMEAAWLKQHGTPYAWSFDDDQAMRRLLQLGDVEAILARWVRAIAWDGFPSCASLKSLARFWNEYAKEQGKPAEKPVDASGWVPVKKAAKP